MNRFRALPFAGNCRPALIWGLTIITVTSLCVLPVVADDFGWASGVNGLFSDATKWSPAGGPPNAGDAAIFGVAGTYTVGDGGTVTIFQVSGGDVTFTGSIGTDSASPGNGLLFAGGTARVSGSITSPKPMEIGQDKMGNAGNATLRVVSGGNVQSTANFALNDVAVSMAGQATSNATLFVENSNSTFTAIGGLNIAGAGTVTVNVLAGGELITSGDIPSATPGIKMGVDVTGKGTLLVDGANARVNNTLQMNVGQLGEGTFTVQNGGQINTSGNTTLPAMVMGFGSSAKGIGYVENGGTLNTTGQFAIGGGGDAEFYVQTGGSVVSTAIGTSAAVFVANAATSTGSATMNGGTWDVNGDFFIGGAGHGQVTVNAGATLDTSNAGSLLTIGFQDGGLGELFINGGQVLRPTASTVITVGIGGRGRMEIHDGSDVADAKLRIAQVATTVEEPSEVIVAGAGSTLTIKDELAVGIADGGQLRVQDGAAVFVTAVTSFAEAGGIAGGQGEIFVSGESSTLSVAGAMTLGNAGRGGLAVDTDGQVNTGAATLGRLVDSEGTANVESGGLWNVGGDLVVGDHGTGFVFLRADGTVALPSGKRVFLGLNSDGTGILNLYGNGLLNVDTEVVVGQNGTGVLNLNESATYTTLAPGPYLLGNLAGSRGEIHLTTGSTFTASGDMTVGVAADGQVTVDATSTFDVSAGSLSIGAIDGSYGEVIVDGGTLLRPAAGITTIGFGGRGRLEIRGGATVTDGEIRVAQIANESHAPSELVVDGAGTTLNVQNGLGLGIEDVGTLLVQNGAQMVVGQGLVAGVALLGQGDVSATGENSKITVTGPMILAESGYSLSSITSGGAVESGAATLAKFATAEATIDIADGGKWNVLGNLVVGDAGLGYVYLRSGGTISVAAGSQITLGNLPGGTGILNIFGDGALDIASDVVIGQEGVGSLNLQEGATYNSIGNIALGVFDGAAGNITVVSAGQMNVNGDLTMAEVFGANAGVVVDGAGSTLAATNIHVGGSQTDVGGLANVEVHNGGQLFVANRLNLWPGGSVNASGGHVTVGDSAAVAAAGEVRVSALGTLSGTGIVNGKVLNAGGTVAPGNSPGTLTVTGAYTQATGGKLQIELAGTVQGGEYDRLLVFGAASISGALQVSLLDGFTPAPGDVFQILTSTAAVNGVFTSGTLPTLTGANWQLEYAPTAISLRVVITGDYNHNGTVDAADYTVWRNSLNQSGLALAADGNGDGHITPLDFNVWKTHFGETAPGSGSQAAVPEPTAFILCFATLLSAVVWRRRK